MTKLFLACAALLASASIAAADVSVVDNKQTIDVDCAKDKTVNLAGNEITATLKGNCVKLAIQGNNIKVTGAATTVLVAGNSNTVTLNGVDELLVAGNENTVSYKGPIAAKKTKVSNPGSKNKITQLK